MQISIQTITDSAIDLADMRNSQFIDQSGLAGTELIRYANLAYRDVYEQITLAHQEYNVVNFSFQIVPGQDLYPLPDDFYKLNGVDLSLDNSGRYLTLRRMQFAERNKFRSGLALTTAPFGQVFKYILVSNSIRFVPLPSQTNLIQLWYTPEPVVINQLSQVVSLPIGCDEYMSLYIAAMMASKEESDPTPFNTKRLEVLDQLKNSLKDRDEGSPSYVVDESTLNSGALYPFRGFD